MIHKALLPSDVYSVVRYFEETGQVKDKEVVNLKNPKLNKTPSTAAEQQLFNVIQDAYNYSWILLKEESCQRELRLC